LFWPLVQESFFISTTLNLRIGSGSLISSFTEVVTEQTMIEPFVSFDKPLPTTRGLAVSAILLTSALVPALAIGWEHRARDHSCDSGATGPVLGDCKLIFHLAAGRLLDTLRDGSREIL